MTFSFCLSKSPKTELHLYFNMSHTVIFFFLFNACTAQFTELIKKKYKNAICYFCRLKSLKSFELHLIQPKIQCPHKIFVIGCIRFFLELDPYPHTIFLILFSNLSSLSKKNAFQVHFELL